MITTKIKKLTVFLSLFGLTIAPIYGTINPPQELFTVGQLDPNPVIDDTFSPWTFINETGCDFELDMFFILNNMTANPYVFSGQINLQAAPEPGPVGQATVRIVTNNEIFNYFGLTSPMDMTHLYFTLSYTSGGQVTRINLGPHDNVRFYVPGCGYVCWIPNIANRTFTLKMC